MVKSGANLIGVVLLMCMPPLAGSAVAQHDALRELAERVDPNRTAAPDRLGHYIRCFRDATLQDARIMAFEVEAQPNEDAVILLTGHIEFPEMREALLAYLRHLGFQNIRDHTERLPSPQLDNRCFGFVTATHALVYTQPGESAETATDTLLGEPLYLLRKSGTDFLLCHTAEGYLGYIRSQDVARVNATEFHRYQAGKQVRMRTDVVTETLSIPLGATLKWVAQTDKSFTLMLPTGPPFEIPRDSATLLGDGPPARVERALATANRFLGTKYLWGGKTVAGVDCSGLVQTSFAASGIYLPRDSNQQVIAGRLTATRWYRQDLRRGDTLYFLGRPGRITHTGIYLGDNQYIEAVTPTVRISSLSADDANYSARGDASFAFAKRLLD